MLPATIAAACHSYYTCCCGCYSAVQIDYRYKCQIFERKNANAHVSTSRIRRRLLLLLLPLHPFPAMRCLSLGRLISKAWNIFPPLLWQAHAREPTPHTALPAATPAPAPAPVCLCSVKRRSCWLYLLRVLLPGKYKFNSFHNTRAARQKLQCKIRKAGKNVSIISHATLKLFNQLCVLFFVVFCFPLLFLH